MKRLRMGFLLVEGSDSICHEAYTNDAEVHIAASNLHSEKPFRMRLSENAFRILGKANARKPSRRQLTRVPSAPHDLSGSGIKRKERAMRIVLAMIIALLGFAGQA